MMISEPDSLVYFMGLARENTQEASDLAAMGIGSNGSNGGYGLEDQNSHISPNTWNENQIVSKPVNQQLKFLSQEKKKNIVGRKRKYDIMRSSSQSENLDYQTSE